MHFYDSISPDLYKNEKYFRQGCKKNQNTHFKFCTFFRKMSSLWDSAVKYCCARQATDDIIWHTRFAWIAKARDRHTRSEWVIITAFLGQQWLHEHPWILHCTYIDCLICDKNDAIVCLHKRTHAQHTHTHTHTHTHSHELKLVLKVLTEKLSTWNLHTGVQQLFTMYCLFVTKHLYSPIFLWKHTSVYTEAIERSSVGWSLTFPVSCLHSISSTLT